VAVNYTLADLRRYVRDLTGIYSYDIVTDTYINKTINEIYFELAATQNWSWSASVGAGGLTSDSSYPAFPATYHTLLSYRTAARLLKQQGDDSGRADTYNANADELLATLFIQDLPANVTGAVDTYDNLVKFVRQLVSVYDNTISNTYIQNKLVEEFVQLNEGYNWPWKSNAGFAASPTNLAYLNASYQRTDTQATSSSAYTFAKILAYGTATRLAGQLSKNEMLIKILQAEFDSILDEMKRVLLHYQKLPASQLIPSFTEVNLENLISLTRQLINDYSNDIPNGLIQQWVIEEANNLSLERDWSYLKTDISLTLPAGVDLFTTPYADAEIISMYLLGTDGNTIEEIKHRPHFLDVDKSSSKYYYKVNTNPDTNINEIQIAPKPDTNIVIGARVINQSALGWDNGFNNAFALFSPRFKMLIPYRVAVKCLAFNGNPNAKNLIPIYLQSAQTQLDAMISYYQGENNVENFQIGVQGLDTRKYIPYFRVN
jgi:hypothetical protein